MTASVLARPEGGAPNERASQKARGPEIGANRTPGPRVVWLTGNASVQFRREPIRLLVVRSEPAATVDGWEWLEGYQLDVFGEAVAQRRVFVRTAGIQAAASIPAPRGRT